MTARIAMVSVLAGILAPQIGAAELRTQAVAAFDHYVAQAEARIREEQRSPQSFLAIQSLSGSKRTEGEARLRRNEVLIAKRSTTSTTVPAGLIHSWLGTAFIPGATVGDVLSVIQDYDHLARYYKPEVMSSHLIVRDGDNFLISMRLRKHKVVTVVLDTEYDVHYGHLDAAHQYSLSHSRRIAEIENAGEPNEHVLDQGRDHGFMWRLNTYWRFLQVDDGVLMQCEAISLTREIPTGLGWLIGPFIENIPRESLQFTLSATRDAVLQRARQSAMKAKRTQSITK